MTNTPEVLIYSEFALSVNHDAAMLDCISMTCLHWRYSSGKTFARALAFLAVTKALVVPSAAGKSPYHQAFGAVEAFACRHNKHSCRIWKRLSSNRILRSNNAFSHYCVSLHRQCMQTRVISPEAMSCASGPRSRLDRVELDLSLSLTDSRVRVCKPECRCSQLKVAKLCCMRRRQVAAKSRRLPANVSRPV